jgi:hypothetical protein
MSKTYTVYTEKECPGIKVVADSIDVGDDSSLVFKRKEDDMTILVAAFSGFVYMVVDE